MLVSRLCRAFAMERSRCFVVSLLEQLDEVRNVGESTLGANLRNGARGRGKHNPCAVEPLLHNPAVGRGVEEPLKLLLEGCERAICQFGNISTEMSLKILS